MAFVVGAVISFSLLLSGADAALGTTATFVDYAQCANGKPPSTAVTCTDGWLNGILQGSNSHFTEDQVTPQRAEVVYAAGAAILDRTITLRYEARKGTIHAYDSLTTWNLTVTGALRCDGLGSSSGTSDCVLGPASTIAIPTDPTVISPFTSASGATSAHEIPGVFTMYGGTLTSVDPITHDCTTLGNCGTSGDDYAHITIHFTVPASAPGDTSPRKVQLLFGGHLAASLGARGWGTGLGSANINGGPYHIKWDLADGASIGNRDNQIQGAAIIPPFTLIINKTALNGNDTFSYSASGSGLPASFSLTTLSGSASQTFANLLPGASGGTRTVSENNPPPPADWAFTSLACSVTTAGDGTTAFSTAGRVATITNGGAGATLTCTYTNTKGTAHLSLTKTPSTLNVCNGANTPVTYTYVVTNDGTVALSGSVVDNNGTPGVPGDDVTVGTFTNLAPAASQTFTQVFTVNGTRTNIATATGTSAGGQSATATATATVTGHVCTISLTKTPSTLNVCNDANTQVTYTYVVSNNSDFFTWTGSLSEPEALKKSPVLVTT